MRATLASATVAAVMIAASASAAPTETLDGSLTAADGGRRVEISSDMAVLAARTPFWEFLDKFPSLKLKSIMPAAQPQELEMELTSVGTHHPRTDVSTASKSPHVPHSELSDTERILHQLDHHKPVSSKSDWEGVSDERRAECLSRADELLKRPRDPDSVLWMTKDLLSFEWPSKVLSEEALAMAYNSGSTFVWRKP